MSFRPTRDQLVDVQGRPLTQGLFLEVDYNVDYAIYTLKEYDHTYQGKKFYSLKKLYLEEEDPTEYIFASKYLTGWTQWMRLCDNKIIRRHIDEWRDELEIKLRAMAVRALRDMSQSENGNFQASKFLADRGWDKNKVGRPSRAEMEKRAAIEKRVEDDFNADIKRLDNYRKK